MRLLLVELDRLRSRRAVVLLLLVGGLLAAGIAASTIYETRPVTPSDLAAAERLAAEEAQQPYVQRELRRCQERPGQYGAADAQQCAELVVPQAEWYLFRSPLRVANVNGSGGMGLIFLVAGLTALIGTTFAGADWSSGSMSNQLLFRPRRVLVWLAKAAAVTLASLVAAAVVLGGFWLAILLTAGAREITTPPRVLDDAAWTVVRGVVLAGVAALGGYALTMLLRHTVGTLALLFVYSVAGEALAAALPFERSGRWSLANNTLAWLRDGREVYDYRVVCQGLRCEQTYLVTLADAAAYLGGLLVIAVGLSVFFFCRRDVP